MGGGDGRRLCHVVTPDGKSLLTVVPGRRMGNRKGSQGLGSFHCSGRRGGRQARPPKRPGGHHVAPHSPASAGHRADLPAPPLEVGTGYVTVNDTLLFVLPVFVVTVIVPVFAPVGTVTTIRLALSFLMVPAVH